MNFKIKEKIMSVLVIGGDKIAPIKVTLLALGARVTKHWNGRKKSSACSKSIPENIDCILMLTDFLNHNLMFKYKKEAKKRKIPVVFSKRSENCVHQQWCQKFDIEMELDCEKCELSSNFFGSKNLLKQNGCTC
jgi:hypothetical protein